MYLIFKNGNKLELPILSAKELTFQSWTKKVSLLSYIHIDCIGKDEVISVLSNMPWKPVLGAVVGNLRVRLLMFGRNLGRFSHLWRFLLYLVWWVVTYVSKEIAASFFGVEAKAERDCVLQNDGNRLCDLSYRVSWTTKTTTWLRVCYVFWVTDRQVKQEIIFRGPVT
jgi:hypothetical protein